MTREEFTADCVLRIVSNVQPDLITDDTDKNIIQFVKKMTSFVYGPSEEEKKQIQFMIDRDEKLMKLDEEIRMQKEQRRIELQNMPKKHVLFYSRYKYPNWDKFYCNCCIKSTALEYTKAIHSYITSHYSIKSDDCYVPLAEYCIITEEQANDMLSKSTDHFHQNKDLKYIDSDEKWIALCKAYGLERHNLKQLK